METRHNATAAPAQAPAWALAMRRLSTWISRDFGGGPRPWKLAWVVNFQKCGTFFFLGALMAWTDRKFNRMRPSMARVFGLETRSVKAG